MKILLRIVAVLAALSGSNAMAESFVQMELSMGMYRIEAEVAATASQRQRGLMFREKMAENHGMLFLLPKANIECMWMKNTLIPLSVVFLDDQGVIVNVEEMQPRTLSNHCSAKPVRFALEMNAGWFRQRGFGPGARLQGLEQAPPPR